MDYMPDFDEFTSFILDRKKQLFTGIIISTLIIISLLGYSILGNPDDKQNEESLRTNFSFILERKDGNISGDVGALKSVLIASVPNYEKLSKKQKSNLEEDISLSYSPITNQISVSVKENSQEIDGKSLVTYLYDKVKNSDLNYFQDKSVYLLNGVSKTSSISDVNSDERSMKQNFFLILVWLVLCVGISILLIVIRDFRYKEVDSVFFLSSKNKIVNLEKFSNTSASSNLVKSIISGPKKMRIVTTTDSNLIKYSDDLTIVTNDLTNLNFEDRFAPEEIVIICEKKKTKKYWYKLQLEISKNYNCPITSVLIK